MAPVGFATPRAARALGLCSLGRCAIGGCGEEVGVSWGQTVFKDYMGMGQYL